MTDPNVTVLDTSAALQASHEPAVTSADAMPDLVLVHYSMSCSG